MRNDAELVVFCRARTVDWTSKRRVSVTFAQRRVSTRIASFPPLAIFRGHPTSITFMGMEGSVALRCRNPVSFRWAFVSLPACRAITGIDAARGVARALTPALGPVSVVAVGSPTVDIAALGDIIGVADVAKVEVGAANDADVEVGASGATIGLLASDVVAVAVAIIAVAVDVTKGVLVDGRGKTLTVGLAGTMALDGVGAATVGLAWGVGATDLTGVLVVRGVMVAELVGVRDAMSGVALHIGGLVGVGVVVPVGVGDGIRVTVGVLVGVDVGVLVGDGVPGPSTV